MREMEILLNCDVQIADLETSMSRKPLDTGAIRILRMLTSKTY